MCTRELHRDDLALVQAAAAGDESAWRRIYDQTQGPLFNFLCYQTGDRDMALDLLQETYVAALRRAGTYRGEGSLLSWLRSVGVKKHLDLRRRAARRVRMMLAYALERTSAGADTTRTVFPGLGDGFQAALNRLSPHQRAALLLRELEGESFADVAAALECTESTARQHNLRARRNLRKWLSEGDDLVFASSAEGSTS